MTTLAVSKPRTYEIGDRNHAPVVASDILYEGAAIGDNGSGYARPLNAGDPFLGFAVEDADNSAGAAGAINVWLRTEGRIQLAISGLAITDVGKQVYASDDDTFTLTATSNSRIGRVLRWVSSGVGIVAFEVDAGGVGYLAPLTDNSGGTAATTIAAIGATYTQSEVRNAVASLAARLATIEQRLK